MQNKYIEYQLSYIKALGSNPGYSVDPVQSDNAPGSRDQRRELDLLLGGQEPDPRVLSRADGRLAGRHVLLPLVQASWARHRYRLR